MGLNKLKKIFTFDDEKIDNDIMEDEYYKIDKDAFKETSDANKMILVEPRAYSESQQIADHLKMRNAVVVNLKRVTSEQAKRIVDFLSGTVYAIGGNLQKIGGGIFLCTPNNMNVQGKITEEDDKAPIHDNNDIDIEW
ncbi:MAG: cell division protein SepF [Bacilli bacterium]|nr:cell division protein SepF [Bacilli bacterium]